MKKYVYNIYNLLRIYFRTHKKIEGNGNKIAIKGKITKRIRIEIKGNNNSIIVSERSKIGNLYIYIYGNNNTIVINEYCCFEEGECWIENNSCKISVGKSTFIRQAHLAATENESVINIGERCMFANGIEIRTGDSHSIIDLETNVRINPAKSVFISNHVWLASNVIVLKGVHIGKDTIVGAASLVTKDLPSNSITGGVPAKVIKQNVTWNAERL